MHNIKPVFPFPRRVRFIEMRLVSRLRVVAAHSGEHLLDVVATSALLGNGETESRETCFTRFSPSRRSARRDPNH